MAAAPLPPVTPSVAAPEAAPLSEGARIVDTFIAPSKTFTDLRRNASWWAPFVLLSIMSLAFFYVVGQKIGYRKVAENQVQASARAAARMDQLSPDQRDRALDRQAKGTEYFLYAYPVVILLFNLIIAAILFATFKFAAGAEVRFKTSLAIVFYATLPALLKLALAMISVAAGASADSFSLDNPVATNPGYFVSALDSPLLHSLGRHWIFF
jgi:Yip1 domain